MAENSDREPHPNPLSIAMEREVSLRKSEAYGEHADIHTKTPLSFAHKGEGLGVRFPYRRPGSAAGVPTMGTL